MTEKVFKMIAREKIISKDSIISLQISFGIKKKLKLFRIALFQLKY
jgi:hypothetical protein